MSFRRLALLLMSSLSCASVATAAPVHVVARRPSSELERFAAHELRRYVYLRTGVVPVLDATLPDAGDAIVCARPDDPDLGTLLDAGTVSRAQGLQIEQYLIRTVDRPSGQRCWIIVGRDRGLLYGAYRFCTVLGIRFYLQGDVIPDQRITGRLPVVTDEGTPLFATRGILPFHDFPEGPDWWSRDDYLTYIHQLPKLRMNFIGFHCYPEDVFRPDPEPHPEPLVWIGREKDIGPGYQVKASYPAFWASTGRERYWGYDPMPTSDFTGGAAELFPAESHGSAISTGLPAQPLTPEQCNESFRRAGVLLHDVFGPARELGIKVCVGTETPLTIPQSVKARLRLAGDDPSDPAVVRALYRGMFRRIQQLYPIDYYWLWTPESWTWAGNNPDQFQATAGDIQAAISALHDLGDPFTLATCGWVLGPGQDRTALDKLLPAGAPVGCINREVGHDLIESGFASVNDRPKWAIPWLENDPNMISPQLWAGRMRYDAADALQLGCTGLLGIHWRTSVIAPNVAAMADAGWDQSYAPSRWNLQAEHDPDTLHGGHVIHSDAPVSGHPDAAVLSTMVEGVSDTYLIGVPAGRYTITLLFAEPIYDSAGRRIFDVDVQGQATIRDLDIFARVGRQRALELHVPNIVIGDGTLHLHYTPKTGQTCIAGFGLEGTTAAGTALNRWVNLGGGPEGKFEGDSTHENPAILTRSRGMPVEDFYVDFARANFGEAVALRTGRLFARMDGMNLPQPSHWERGPGAINPLPLAERAYDFVRELAALRGDVAGAGNLARFDYWLNTFRYQHAMAAAGALRADLDRAMTAITQLADPAEKRRQAEQALVLRIQLARAWDQMMARLLACVETPGELGTIANLEQHNRQRLRFLDLHDSALAEALGRPLPSTCAPSQTYEGSPRLIVPTVRTTAAKGEVLNIRVMVLARTAPEQVILHWRRWNQSEFHSVVAEPAGRSVFEAKLPAVDDLEYYVTARSTGGGELIWPATAPQLCQTVIRGL